MPSHHAEVIHCAVGIIRNRMANSTQHWDAHYTRNFPWIISLFATLREQDIGATSLSIFGAH
jgi:hypothetical protein